MYDDRSQQVRFAYKFTGKERRSESGLGNLGLFLVSSMLLLSAFAVHGVTDANSTPRVLRLCELVNNWKDHNRQEVRVRAIYAVGAEQTVLYDPACQHGRDLTDVEFRSHAKGVTAKLDHLVAKDKRAWVTLEGLFYGPEPYKDIDPKLPESIRERLKNSPRRYGHMDSLETMISVTSVVEASRVGAETPTLKRQPAHDALKLGDPAVLQKHRVQKTFSRILEPSNATR